MDIGHLSFEPEPSTPRFEAAQDPDSDRFARILKFAHELADKNRAALRELVVLLARKLQADLIVGLLTVPTHDAETESQTSLMWGRGVRELTTDGHDFDELAVLLPDDARTVQLATDAVLPLPWSKGRLLYSLANIGGGRPEGPWQEDPGNHRIELWLPLGLAWVYGGNHSITAGIALGEGEVRVTQTYDISPIYRHVHCDGEFYRRTEDDAELGPVANIELAAIWEIGRLMHGAEEARGNKLPHSSKHNPSPN